MVDFGADESFAYATEKIKEHYGVEVAPSTARLDVEKHAQIIHEQINEQALCVSPAKEADTIIGEFDGSMVPVVTTLDKNNLCDDQRKNKKHEWKEARLAIARAKGAVDPIYAVTFGSIDEAGKKFTEVVKGAGDGEKTKIHCVCDGAPWLAEQVEKLFGTRAVFLLDFYHVSEYLAKAAQCCAPATSCDWMREQQSLLKQNLAYNVLENLKTHMLDCSLQKECSALKCFNYLAKRIHQLDYKNAIASDLPIGSGEVESAHRSIIQARLKIPGAWWNINNAQNMLDLRVMRANGLWSQYWKNIQPSSGVHAYG